MATIVRNWKYSIYSLKEYMKGMSWRGSISRYLFNVNYIGVRYTIPGFHIQGGARFHLRVWLSRIANHRFDSLSRCFRVYTNYCLTKSPASISSRDIRYQTANCFLSLMLLLYHKILYIESIFTFQSVICGELISRCIFLLTFILFKIKWLKQNILSKHNSRKTYFRNIIIRIDQ